jgi:hypothetical protein
MRTVTPAGSDFQPVFWSARLSGDRRENSQARASTTLICEPPAEAETGPTPAATSRIHLPRVCQPAAKRPPCCHSSRSPRSRPYRLRMVLGMGLIHTVRHRSRGWGDTLMPGESSHGGRPWRCRANRPLHPSTQRASMPTLGRGEVGRATTRCYAASGGSFRCSGRLSSSQHPDLGEPADRCQVAAPHELNATGNR